jgi:hypothetical protein
MQVGTDRKNLEPWQEPLTRKDQSGLLSQLSDKLTPKSFIKKTKKKALDIFKNFEKVCNSYEKIPNPIFTTNYSTPKPKNSEIIFKTPKSSTKIQYLISELKKRIKSYNEIKTLSVSSNRLKIQSETNVKVGPGTYQVKYPKKVESYEFSIIPRLNTPISHNLNLISAFRSPKLRKNSIIQKNKLLTPTKNTTQQPSKYFQIPNPIYRKKSP